MIDIVTLSRAKRDYCLDAGTELALAEKYAGMGAAHTATYHANRAVIMLARANDIARFFTTMSVAQGEAA